ncbi:putative peptidoglycan endopeptidase LytE precursor [Enhygromyxa salina]|uniref:Putative peptidoglycan endopeptidase LytE n=1 Tax=Enhygromyxa salina TaxID=215803 RepID=A0A2S9XC62_9BACT|nr:penicillin-insensitive murein endopeptidase [Enhygromyxa salina]PRP90447.1 putative peptidoglycan endopeptidase LytE precursor [Enhygromyxa salina]
MRWPGMVLFVGLTGLASLAGPQSSALAGSTTHVVRSGDTLWELAEDSGCTIAQLREANDLGPDDPIVIGRELDLSPCPGHRQRASGRTYVVASGDSLAAIARRHGTTIAQLRELNGIEGSLIRVGQKLRVPGEARRAVRLLTGQSRGRPGHGWLHQPTQLPRSGLYYRRRVERTWAAAHVIDRTLNAVHDAHAAFPKLHRLAIGDLSDKDGGPLHGHHSHQSGRDIDIGLYYRRVPAGYPKEFVAATKDTLDAAATWALVESFVRTSGEDGGVEKIFLDYELQGWLYAAARADGWSKAKLRDVFQYPDGKYAKHGIVRHEPKHDDHIHVRFSCAPNDGPCR